MPLSENRPETEHENTNGRTHRQEAFGDITEEELERLKSHRRERYTEDYQAPPKSTRVPNKYVMIACTVIVFLYFATVFVLNTIGVIGQLTMLLMLVPVVLAVLAIYFLRKNRR